MMQKLIYPFVLAMLVSGCTTLDFNYYTDPNSPGYTESAIGGLCEECNRVFNVSKQQYDTIENVQCLYDGHIQNLKMAVNRYTYLIQQQEAQADQRALSNFAQQMQDIQRRRDEAQQKNIQAFQQSIQNWQRPGSSWNPLHVTIDDN